MIQRVNKLFVHSTDYRNYNLINNCLLFEINVTIRFHRGTEGPTYGKITPSITKKQYCLSSFSKNWNWRAMKATPMSSWAWTYVDITLGTHPNPSSRRIDMWQHKHEFSSSVKIIINAHAELPTETLNAKELCLTTYLTIVDDLLPRYN